MAIFIYITNSNKKEAERVATHLLKKKLIACANIFHIDSIYWWKGKIEKTKEYVLVVETIKRNFEKVKKEVIKVHSYSIPCIAEIKVKTNKEYEDWLKSEVR